MGMYAETDPFLVIDSFYRPTTLTTSNLIPFRPFRPPLLSPTVILQVRPFQPAPPSALSAIGRAFNDAHQACLVDVEENGLCRPRDPIEAIFGGGGPSSLRSIFDSDPFFRDDPFIRLAATPPSASRSPRILDEIFPQTMTSPMQISQVDDDFAPLFDVLDGMMNSAMRMALTPPPQMQRISISFGPEEEEEGGVSAPRSPADAAVSLLDCMVDGLIDHAASASASNDVEEDQEVEPVSGQNEEDGIIREESEREDALHARSGRSRPSNDDGEEAARYVPEALVEEAEETSAKPFHPVWDRVSLARKIAQHGRDVLADEEKTKAGADGDLRRRLSEEDQVKSDVRQRMARRLTEVVTFGHLSIVPMMMPPQMITVVDETEQDMTPRLGFGFQTDRCLWSLHREEGGNLSGACSDALTSLDRFLVEVKKEEMGFAQFAPEAPTQDLGIGYRFAEYVEANRSSLFVFWVSIVTALLMFSCCFEEDDEDSENEEYGEASDYVLVDDTDDDSEEDRAPEGAVAFVGVPLPVV
uniref:Uncharacterized protein n=1 Tax=Odontella aurita TaxID=265563 RepID=A0A7S4MTX1_9STRA|mmetsp:Transcript_32190/g.96483  ORF Transcript_32190/g.96483 Transcript_32190/m.96483 type:complete len:528 (+) Transcript_32190:482-2065(+)